MAYSSAVADRIRKILTPQTSYVEKEMFGGVAFMVDDKMCVGVNRDKNTGEDRLMARIDPEFYYTALKREGCHEMDFVGRPMVGFVFVFPEGYATDEDLAFWISKTLEYNRQIPAKTTKKKRALLAPPEKKTYKIEPLPKYKPPRPKTVKQAPAPKKKAAVATKTPPKTKTAKKK